MTQSRRDFFRRMGIGLGSGAMLSAIENLSLTNAMAGGGSGYRALVCVFLAGGNDCNNTIIPLETTQYNSYVAARQSSGLAVTSNLTITPTGLSQFMMHPSFGVNNVANTGLHQLWNQGKLIFVPNAGPLVAPLVSPTPRTAYANNPNLRPSQLFSHSDQVREWQSAVPKGSATTGWGGRTADQFAPHVSSFPMLTTIAGTTTFTVGQPRRPLALSTANGFNPPQPPGYQPNLNNMLALSGFAGDPQGANRRLYMDYVRYIDWTSGELLRAKTAEVTDQALQVDAALRTADVNLTTIFPNTNLGNQLLQVARVIKANLTLPALNLDRQIFFVQLGGFDTHRGQVANGAANSQNALLLQASVAMRAFYDFTVAEGIANRVTTFTHSDFGRTLNPAGSGNATVGSDHAWGNHMWVMGGSVIGNRFYGINGPNGTPFPTLQMSGPQDTDTRGRWIPTTATEQYANTLAKWFGLPQTNGVLDAVFPNLRANFAPNTFDLGFLTPLP